jgi:hypothetical protein
VEHPPAFLSFLAVAHSGTHTHTHTYTHTRAHAPCHTPHTHTHAPARPRATLTLLSLVAWSHRISCTVRFFSLPPYFGGVCRSYSGALSAWLRLLYPSTVYAAISTSSPINAVEDFSEYQQVVQKSLLTAPDGSVTRKRTHHDCSDQKQC